MQIRHVKPAAPWNPTTRARLTMVSAILEMQRRHLRPTTPATRPNLYIGRHFENGEFTDVMQ